MNLQIPTPPHSLGQWPKYTLLITTKISSFISYLKIFQSFSYLSNLIHSYFFPLCFSPSAAGSVLDYFLLNIFNEKQTKKVVRRQRKVVPDSKNELAVVVGEIPPRTGESNLGSIGKQVRPPPPPPSQSEQVNSER